MGGAGKRGEVVGGWSLGMWRGSGRVEHGEGGSGWVEHGKGGW